MHKYIIMGVQGCGKGTQATLLKESLDLAHISVGDIFRWHIQSHTKLGARIKRTMVSSWTAFRETPGKRHSSWRATISTPCC
jgi:adenylate kinase